MQGTPMFTASTMPDNQVAEFLDLAKSANVIFGIVDDRLSMRASNPNWALWRPCRHLLDEIGSERIASYLKTTRT
jgi:hypothetical protein